MSIKNPQIKHIVYWNNGYMPGLRYLCSSALTPEKIAYTPDEVTCKNCLKLNGRRIKNENKNGIY